MGTGRIVALVLGKPTCKDPAQRLEIFNAPSLTFNAAGRGAPWHFREGLRKGQGVEKVGRVSVSTSPPSPPGQLQHRHRIG